MRLTSEHDSYMLRSRVRTRLTATHRAPDRFEVLRNAQLPNSFTERKEGTTSVQLALQHTEEAFGALRGGHPKDEGGGATVESPLFLVTVGRTRWNEKENRGGLGKTVHPKVKERVSTFQVVVHLVKRPKSSSEKVKRHTKRRNPSIRGRWAQIDPPQNQKDQY